MRKKLGLVGVGSLGGYLAKKLQADVDTIYAVDPDIVEEKNLRNSIYKKADINKPKVLALKEKVTKCKIIPIQRDIRETDLPKVDHVIDCRDIVNRNIETDVKFTIANERLRVDCTKPNLKEIDTHGKYAIELGKRLINRAGGLARDFLMSKQLEVFEYKNQRIYLPIADIDVETFIEKHLDQYQSCVDLESLGSITSCEDLFFFNPNPGGA